MSCASFIEEQKRETKRGSNEDKLEKLARVSPFVFDSHDTTKENTDDGQETLKE